MSFSKELNKWVANHGKALKRMLILLMVIWFVSGLVLVDVLDPYLFVALWLPPGAIVALFCFRW